MPLDSYTNVQAGLNLVPVNLLAKLGAPDGFGTSTEPDAKAAQLAVDIIEYPVVGRLVGWVGGWFIMVGWSTNILSGRV
jgi:hypothetical protein